MFNSKQERAIASTSKTTAVVAAPGSGKTGVIVERIRRTPGVSRVVLTYTNGAARELATRLQGVNLQYLGTLHGYCFRLLQRFGELRGYRQGGINLIDEKETDRMLRAIMKRLGYSKLAMKEVTAAVSKKAGEAISHGANLVAREYFFELKRASLVDFDQVLREGLALLSVESVRKLMAVSELVVDEAQDSSLVDWVIYNTFPAASLFVVGDPDQGIFRFRGARPEGFQEYAIENADTVITLETNYRSGTTICAAASALISHNTNRIPKSVIPFAPRADVVTVQKCATDQMELQYIISKLVRMDRPADAAILCRRNKMVDQFRAAAEAAGLLPTRPPATLPHDWDHALNVTAMLLDYRSDIITSRVLDTIAPGKLEEVRAEALTHGNWLSVQAAKMGVLPKSYLDADASLEHVRSDLVTWNVSPESRQVIADRIALLPQSSPRLADLVHDLFNHRNWTPEAEQTEGVSVLTIHGAKGREWPIVFLTGWEDGVIPTMRKDSTPADLEEERRLAFVAMTRAKDQVHISYAETRFDYGKATTPQPSRFTKEAGF